MTFLIFSTVNSFCQLFNTEFYELRKSTLDSLTIINEIIENEISSKIFAKSNRIEKLLTKRKIYLREISLAEPEIIFQYLLSKEYLEQVRNNYPNLVENLITTVGNIVHYFIDDFNGHNSCLRTLLKTESGEVFHLLNHIPTNTKTNDLIRITGYQLEDILIQDEDTFELLTPFIIPKAKSESFKILFLMVSFYDQPPVPISIESLRSHILPENSAMHRIYREMSYNKVDFDAEIYGWYIFQRPGKDNNGNIIPIAGGELFQVLNYYNIDLNDVDYITWAPYIDGNWPYLGIAIFGRELIEYNGQTYYIGTNIINAGLPITPLILNGMPAFDYVAIHEIGHNMWLGHSDGWEYGNSSGSIIQYGNKFDIMGRGRWAYHFNLIQKKYLGWLDENQIVEINQSGMYTINALQTLDGIKGARISLNSTSDESLFI